jgi:hypothetical protein
MGVFCRDARTVIGDEYLNILEPSIVLEGVYCLQDDATPYFLCSDRAYLCRKCGVLINATLLVMYLRLHPKNFGMKLHCYRNGQFEYLQQ